MRSSHRVAQEEATLKNPELIDGVSIFRLFTLASKDSKRLQARFFTAPPCHICNLDDVERRGWVPSVIKRCF
jgi:hypothetical protein